MINRQNPSERAQLKEGSDALDSARLVTPAITDFYNDICQELTLVRTNALRNGH